MTCRYAQHDAAYVLGALAPEERHRYEQHLPDCEACTAAVREIAGLPGLLARLPADRVNATGDIDDPADPPVPQTMLPALLRRVRRDRRRTRLRVGLAAAAVAASVTAAGAVSVQHLTKPRPVPPARTLSLQAVGNRPMHGTVQIIPWGWGSTVRMTCHSAYSDGNGTTVYTLYVTDRAGTEYPVSSWRSQPEEDVTVPGGIALTPDEVVSLQVRDDHQTVVMQGP